MKLHQQPMFLAAALVAAASVPGVLPGLSPRAAIAQQATPPRPAAAPGQAAQTAPLPDALDTNARPIALAEAVSLARQNAPVAVQARGNERATRAAVRSAYAAFIPNVSVSTGAVRQFTGGSTTRINNGVTEALPSQPWSYSNGLSFNVDLFDGGRRFFDVGVSKANVTAAEAGTVAAQFTTSLNVKQQYYAVLAARESEGAARAQLAQAEQNLRSATARVAAGAATKSDSLRAVIDVGNAQLNLLSAVNNLAAGNAALTRLVASPFTVTASEADTAGRADTPIDSATLARLAAAGPAVQQAAANATAARASRRAARAPYLPTITMSYSRAGSGVGTYGFGDPTYQCGLGAADANGVRQATFCPAYNYTGRLSFALSYPLFNQLNREETVVRADVEQNNAEASLRDTRLAQTQQLTAFLGALQTAQERVRIQDASVAAAAEDLRVQQQRYALGASTLLDVLTSQTQLTQARLALIQARYDARVAKAQIEALVGREL